MKKVLCVFLVMASPVWGGGLEFHGSFVEGWEGHVPDAAARVAPMDRAEPPEEVAPKAQSTTVTRRTETYRLAPRDHGYRPHGLYDGPAFGTVQTCFGLRIQGEGFFVNVGKPCAPIYRPLDRPYGVFPKDVVYPRRVHPSAPRGSAIGLPRR